MAPARTGRLAVFYVVLAAIVAAVVIVVSKRGRTRRRSRRSRAATTRQRPNDCLGTPRPAAEGKPLPETAPPQPRAGGPVVRRQAVGPVREPLELAGHARRQAAPARTTRAATGSRASPATSSCVNGEDAGRSTGTATPRRQGHDRRHARRRAGHRRPQARPARPRRRRSRARPARSRASTSSRRARRASAARSSSRAAARPTRSRRGGKSSARSRYNKENGRGQPATSSAPRAARSGSERPAVDRNLNNVQLIPLDEAEPAPAQARRRRPRRSRR